MIIFTFFYNYLLIHQLTPERFGFYIHSLEVPIRTFCGESMSINLNRLFEIRRSPMESRIGNYRRYQVD